MKTPFFKHQSFIILLAFICNILGPIPVNAQDEIRLPAPGVMVHLSPEFTPAHLVGVTIHPENALQFDFLINRGEVPLSNDGKKEEYDKLVKYFLASLTIPDEDQWVNLSPYEKDRIIKDDFGKTEMGRDLLAQDYLLKQITSSLIYPEENLGKKFWNRVYERAWKEYGTSNVPVNTFNKVWIIPDEAVVYESGNTAYVLRDHLKVMLEEDYLSLKKHTGPNKTHTIASQIVKEIVLPELEKEVNTGKNFANLRQIYSGMILATWYKKALKESFLGRIYANKARIKGVDQDPKANEAIYQRYLKAFKKGVFNYIKEDVDKYTNETIPRKYFSGGTRDFAQTGPVTDGYHIGELLLAKRGDTLPRNIDIPDLAYDAQNETDKTITLLRTNRDAAMINWNKKLTRRQFGLGLTASLTGIALLGWITLHSQKKPDNNAINTVTTAIENRFKTYNDDLIKGKVPDNEDEQIVKYFEPMIKDIDPTVSFNDGMKGLSGFYKQQNKVFSTHWMRTEVNGQMKSVYVCDIGDLSKFPEGFHPVLPGFDSSKTQFVMIKNKQHFPSFIEDFHSTTIGEYIFFNEDGLRLDIERMWQEMQAYKGLSEEKLRARIMDPASSKLATVEMAQAFLLGKLKSSSSKEDLFRAYLNNVGAHELAHQQQMARNLFSINGRPDLIDIKRSERQACFVQIQDKPEFGLWTALEWSKSSRKEYQQASAEMLGSIVKETITTFNMHSPTGVSDIEHVVRTAWVDGIFRADQDQLRQIGNAADKDLEQSDKAMSIKKVLAIGAAAGALLIGIGGYLNSLPVSDNTILASLNLANVRYENTYPGVQPAQGDILSEDLLKRLHSENPDDVASILKNPEMLDLLVQKALTVRSNLLAVGRFKVRGTFPHISMQYNNFTGDANGVVPMWAESGSRPDTPLDRSRKILDNTDTLFLIATHMPNISEKTAERMFSSGVVGENFRWQLLENPNVSEAWALGKVKQFPSLVNVNSVLTKTNLSGKAVQQLFDDYGTELFKKPDLQMFTARAKNTNTPTNILQRFTQPGFYNDISLAAQKTLDSLEKKEVKSPAMMKRIEKSPFGGIDLNSANFNLQIKRNGKGVPLPLDQQDMAQINSIQGFVPEIIRIEPAVDMPIVEELQENQK